MHGRFRYAGAASAPASPSSAAEFARQHGVPAASFEQLPDAAKFAWSWRAFNEPAVDRLARLQNSRVVVYEDLCRDPDGVARQLFAFAGLSWNQPTSAAGRSPGSIPP